MYSVHADLQVYSGGHAHQLVEAPIRLQLDLLLFFALVSVLNGLDCMHAHNDMHVVESLACDQQHRSPCFLGVSYWDGSLTCTGVVSFVSACCAYC